MKFSARANYIHMYINKRIAQNFTNLSIITTGLKDLQPLVNKHFKMPAFPLIVLCSMILICFPFPGSFEAHIQI